MIFLCWLLFSLLVPGCDNVQLVGNGLCNNETNNGGPGNGFANNFGFIGNGFCDDGLNNAECQFDGEDCCGPSVNTDYCTLCTCK